MQEVHDYNYRRLPGFAGEQQSLGSTPEWKPPDDWADWERRLQEFQMGPEDRDRMLLRLAKLERALRVHPTTTRITTGEGIALERNDLSLKYLDMGDMPRAFRQLQGAVGKAPYLAFLSNNMGAMYLEIGDLERAGYYLNQAIQHQEDLDTAYGNRALMHIEQGKYLDAYHDLATAIRLAPGDPAHHNNMGVLFLEAGFPETALLCFMSALERGAGNPMYPSNLGFAYREMGNRTEATRHFRDADRMEAEQFEAALRENAG